MEALEIFERLKDLSGDEFEIQHKQIINAEIERLANGDPHRLLKLQRIQFRADAIRFKYRKNEQMCRIKMFEMMMESLKDLAAAWNKLR